MLGKPMSDYKFLKPNDLEETLVRLLDMQMQSGSDQEENLLLLSLVNLLGIIGIMQKQLTSQESNLTVDYGNEINEIKPSYSQKTSDLKSIDNKHRKGAREKRSNDKIVNKMNNKNDYSNSKIIKWDSRLKKKIKEPLYI